MPSASKGSAKINDRTVSWEITERSFPGARFLRVPFHYRVVTPEGIALTGFARSLPSASREVLTLVKEILGVEP